MRLEGTSSSSFQIIKDFSQRNGPTSYLKCWAGHEVRTNQLKKLYLKLNKKRFHKIKWVDLMNKEAQDLGIGG